METKTKRPVSIWIAQILLSLLGLFMLLSVGFSALMLVISGTTAAVVLLIPIIFSLVFAALFFVPVWGMAKRLSFGRWLGVGALSLCLLLYLVAQLVPT